MERVLRELIDLKKIRDGLSQIFFNPWHIQNAHRERKYGIFERDYTA